jgi:hypothetical protein
MTEWQASRIIELLEGITAMLEKMAYPETWVTKDLEAGPWAGESAPRGAGDTVPRA